MHLKLLYTLTAYPPSIGGAQLHHHQLAQQLMQSHQVSVVSQWDSNRTDWLLGTTLMAPSEDLHYEVDGVCVLRIGFSPAEKLSLIPCTVLYYLAKDACIQTISSRIQSHMVVSAQGCNLIHNVRIGREPISFASLEIAHELDVPFIFTPVHHPRWSGFRNRAFLKLMKQSDGIIALTQAEKEGMVQEGISPERVFVTGIGPILADQADPEEFRRKHGVDGPMVLFLGQHYRYKGYLEVLESAELVWKTFPETHFMFIGPKVGNSEKHFEARKDRRIHRFGIVDLQEKTDALSATDILCVPSMQESFGGVYTEAWSFEKPVMGCPIPAVKDVIQQGEDGILVRQEAHDIAEKIIFLIRNPADAQRFGRAGKEKVERRFSWERIATLTEAAYRDVLNKG